MSVSPETPLSDDAIEALQNTIQRKIDNKELDAALEYYDPDIIYIGPAFPQIVAGKDALKAAFGRHFRNLQRASSYFGEMKIQHLPDGDFIINCRVEGKVVVYLSETHFRGYLTRVFAYRSGAPRIICEHFSLIP